MVSHHQRQKCAAKKRVFGQTLTKTCKKTHSLSVLSQTEASTGSGNNCKLQIAE